MEMPDREKVISGMSYCINYAQRIADAISEVPCKGCPYAALKSNAVGQGDCIDTLFHDALALLRAQEPKPTVSHWINVNDRMPAETHSIFWPLYGRKEWRNAMWREQSDKVLVTVTFKDGTRLVTTGATHDGEWYTSISKTLNPIVTHWMPHPEPPKEEDDDD